jgi:hypothetical protein
VIPFVALEYWAAAAALLASLFAAAKAWRAPIAEAPSAGDARLGLAVALGIAAGAALLFSGVPVFLVGGDEYVRYRMAMEWSRAPYFATHDHVWLGGHFYLLGALHALVGRPEAVVRIASGIGAVLAVALSYRIALLLWRDVAAAVLAGVFASAHWVMLWLWFNPWSEAIALPSLLGAAYGFLRAQEDGSDDGAVLLAAVAAGIGTTARYECWYVAAVTGLWVLWRTWCGWRAGRPLLPLLAACVAIGLYPVLWMLSCWVHAGSPLAFLHTTTVLNMTAGFDPVPKPWWHHFLAYPRLLAVDHWPALPLVAVGIARALGSPGRRLPRRYLLAFGALLFVAMAATSGSGLGASTRPRYTYFLLAALAPLGAGALAGLEGTARRWGLRAAAAAAALFLLANQQRGTQHYPNAWRVRASSLALATQVARSADSSRAHAGQQSLQWEDRMLYLYFRDPGDLDGDVIMFHARYPDNVRVLSQWDDVRRISLEAPLGTLFLVERGALATVAVPDWIAPQAEFPDYVAYGKWE